MLRARLMRWILLLQEVDMNSRHKKGAENLVQDHLSRTGNILTKIRKLPCGIVYVKGMCDPQLKNKFFKDVILLLGRHLSVSIGPTIYKDATDFVSRCEFVQRQGEITQRDEDATKLHPSLQNL
ncbi:hypothetical protein Tco_0525355 [Tanacetum coccineum]